MSASTARAIQAAAETFRRHVTGDHDCPECGSDDTEDNGLRPTAALYTLRCIACDHQWEPNLG